MAAILITLVGAWLAMVAAPNTPIAIRLRRYLVEAPAATLNRVTRGHVLLAVMLVVFVGLMVWQLEDDGIRLLSLMAPEIVGWLTMFEVSVYLDALAAVIVVSTSGRLGDIARALGRPLAPRQRASRARRRRAVSPAANDDDEGDGAVSAHHRIAA